LIILRLSLLKIEILGRLLVKLLIILKFVLISYILILDIRIVLISLLKLNGLIVTFLTEKYFILFKKLNNMSYWWFIDVPIQRLQCFLNFSYNYLLLNIVRAIIGCLNHVVPVLACQNILKIYSICKILIHVEILLQRYVYKCV
jgi:hypothetical protein